MKNKKNISLPSDITMDKEILKILNKNLSLDIIANGEIVICNKFATSLKIIRYIKKIIKYKNANLDNQINQLSKIQIMLLDNNIQSEKYNDISDIIGNLKESLANLKN